MTEQAPRLDRRLTAAIARLDDEGAPIAETNRRVGALASELGLARPSYQQVRQLVHAVRETEAVRREALDLVLDVQSRHRPLEALFELLGP